ncbi:MAG: peptidoglycan DD-metalloendopeptidase family protein, partial [Methylobacteriaceae bacterium]|nr:peptidoglycan DD-metalloendopeptidase family protein [Methylobacteriaceae bacterium]
MTNTGRERQWRGATPYLFAVCVLAAPGLARAQAKAQPPAADVGASASLDSKSRELADRRAALRGVEDTIDAAETQRRKLESDIEAIRTDRARLNAALIETTDKIRDGETRVDAAQKRLDGLTASEQAIRVSLGNRRAVVGEVLASLQRMGRRPPPALLVRPEDMLSAIRTSMLLGAVLPELRAETEALATDLTELVKLRSAINGERDTLSRELAGMQEERQRLAMLVEARQLSLAAAQHDLEAQHDRTTELSRKAASLRDLIATVESNLANQRASEEAAKAEAARKQAEAEKNASRTQVAALPAPFTDVARLAPAIAFADAKGLLPLPVNGSLIKAFGAPDGFGASEKGLSLSARPQAVVTAPCDGWIAYSGPYRTYGQLLIINAGSGYYVVLAGMERINVDVGQFVLTGEPVATMGD